MELHGGEITVSSAPDEGSVFVVTLPIMDDGGDNVRRNEAGAEDPAAPPVHSVEPIGRRVG